MKKPGKAKILIPLTLLAILSGCSQEKEISYANDIAPILNKSCMKCHTGDGKGLKKSGLNMSTYEDLMKGTNFGPVIAAGSSISSTLVRLVEGRADPSLKMPHGENKEELSAEEIALIKKWVDQGAKNN